MSERIGDWIQTYSGRQWWPHDPRPEDVHHEDFPAIAQVTRFGGSCRLADRPLEVTLPRYTIAQHMCLVHDLVESIALGNIATLRKCALTHDLHEIYCPGDQLSPFLRVTSGMPEHVIAGIRWLKSICKAAAHCVRTTLDLPLESPALVKHCDYVLLATERRDLMADAPELRAHWRALPEPWSKRIEVWPAERAWVEWQERFTACFGWTP